MAALLVIASCSIACTLKLVGARSVAADESARDLRPNVGQPAPNFSLPAVNGREVTLSSFRGQDVPIAFFCGCDRCHQAAIRIGKLQKSGKLRNLITVISLDKKGAKTFQSQTHLAGILLSDPSENTSTLYASSNCPRFWRISAKGKISFRSSSGLDGRALHNALVAISRGIGDQAQ